MKKIVILGGGVIGLSWAYELSRRGHRVTLLDTNSVGGKSSWAGAGILLPGNQATAVHPIEHLEALSNHLHVQWHQQLLETTNIDNGYRECGGLYVARSAGENSALLGQQLDWDQRKISYEVLELKEARARFPQLNLASVKQILLLPAEAQLRNPHHLKALQNACLQQHVVILDQLLTVDLMTQPDRIGPVEVHCPQRGKLIIEGEDYGFAAGAWSGQLLNPLGFRIPVTPVRGQMVLFKLSTPLQSPIVNEGSRYLVPRSDGHVLVGATVEEVGFNESTATADIDELTRWVESLCPQLNLRSKVSQWAGLRPGSYDGFPFLGRLAGVSNAWIATGHFKTGLQLSTGTAVVMSDLMEGISPPIDLQPFSPSRGIIHSR